MKYYGKTRFDPLMDRLICQKFGFKQYKEGNLIRYIGSLQPTPESFNYDIEIKSYPISDPDVYVTNKKLDFFCKHLWTSGRLCLYNHFEYKWHQNRSIGKDIIPIVASWLYFYEEWETTGIWYYDQYPHEKPKEETVTK